MATPEHFHVMRRAKGQLRWANGDSLESGELWECQQPSCELRELRELSATDERRLVSELLAAGVLKIRGGQ